MSKNDAKDSQGPFSVANRLRSSLLPSGGSTGQVDGPILGKGREIDVRGDGQPCYGLASRGLPSRQVSLQQVLKFAEVCAFTHRSEPASTARTHSTV